jgi:hypothetical protein
MINEKDDGQGVKGFDVSIMSNIPMRIGVELACSNYNLAHQQVVP